MAQAAESAPSVQTPLVSAALASTQTLAVQCSGLLQRSPTAPPLQLQPAPAESCAQRPSSQSESSPESHGVPTAPVVHLY
jgi:hypothetical protein